jgi:hypothetical protein
MRKKAVFFLILVIFLAVIAEAVSYFGLHFLSYRPIGAAVFIVRRDTEKPLGKMIEDQTKWKFFDRELGWSRSQDSSTNAMDGVAYTFLEDGSRWSGIQEGPVAISFYGCSGTMGMEVTDQHSFPAFVSELTNLRVKNWGVAGYGMDQALLNLEKKLKSGQETAPTIILSFGTEAINRNVSAWRLFYSGENLLKPRLMKQPDGTFKAQNPLLTNPEAYFDSTDAEILETLAPYDYWLTSKVGSRTIIKPGVDFPYTLSLMDSMLYFYGKAQSKLVHPEKALQTPFNLYDQTMPLDHMCAIIDRFFEICQQNGKNGMLVLLTGKFYVDASLGRLESDTLKLDIGTARKLDDNLTEYLDKKGYPYVDTLPIVASILQKEGSMEDLFCVYEHPSPRFTKLIAEAIVQKLQPVQSMVHR